jgi:hypothetical protein
MLEKLDSTKVEKKSELTLVAFKITEKSHKNKNKNNNMFVDEIKKKILKIK